MKYSRAFVCGVNVCALSCGSHTRRPGKRRRILAVQMLAQDTTPEQRRDKKYQIRHNELGEVHVSVQQRSWIQTMLRKYLGHKDVAFFIWHNGLPELINPPPGISKSSKEVLQSILDDGMRWHASLLQSLIEHRTGPELEHARRMSSREMAAWRLPKQQKCRAAKEALKRGQRLREERDSNKRSYDEMSATEQQLLEDFETQVLEKRVKEASLRVDMKPFRGSLRVDFQ